jgi:hypothetical protein
VKDWCLALSRAIVDGRLGLFSPLPQSQATFTIEPRAMVVHPHAKM